MNRIVVNVFLPIKIKIKILLLLLIDNRSTYYGHNLFHPIHLDNHYNLLKKMDINEKKNLFQLINQSKNKHYTFTITFFQCWNTYCATIILAYMIVRLTRSIGYLFICPCKISQKKVN